MYACGAENWALDVRSRSSGQCPTRSSVTEGAGLTAEVHEQPLGDDAGVGLEHGQRHAGEVLLPVEQRRATELHSPCRPPEEYNGWWKKAIFQSSLDPFNSPSTHSICSGLG